MPASNEEWEALARAYQRHSDRRSLFGEESLRVTRLDPDDANSSAGINSPKDIMTSSSTLGLEDVRGVGRQVDGSPAS
eukprot:560133-Amorphochlora_amoeboformis.AAC.2